MENQLDTEQDSDNIDNNLSPVEPSFTKCAVM